MLNVFNLNKISHKGNDFLFYHNYKKRKKNTFNFFNKIINLQCI